MGAYLIRRALHSLFALVGLIMLVFFMARLTGSPADLYLPLDATLEARQEFNQRHGFDRPVIGVKLLDTRLARRYGIEHGLAIGTVDPGGPAARAGIEGAKIERNRLRGFGDVITKVDGKPVDDVDDLMWAFEEKGVGATVRLTVERDGKSRDIDVKLDSSR